MSIKAQTHACESGPEGFQEMAEATDQMIEALQSLHETLATLNLVLEMRDIDLPKSKETVDLPWPLPAQSPTFRP